MSSVIVSSCRRMRRLRRMRRMRRMRRGFGRFPRLRVFKTAIDQKYVTVILRFGIVWNFE